MPVDDIAYAPAVPTHHAIDYIELSVTDIDAAKHFYSKAFGWTFNDYGPGYAGILAPGKDGEVGGLRLVDEVTRGGPLVVLYSETLEASCSAVELAGGRIVKPIFEFPGGRRFQFLDPSGNELAVWGPLG
jgi:predicted enzyme related to lactoylglutathione lyase